MASSVSPFLTSLIKPSIETTSRRKIIIPLIKALNKDSLSSPSESNDQLDPVKLALARAKAYKKSIQSNPTPKFNQNEDAVSEIGGNTDGVSMEYSEKKDKGLAQGKRAISMNESAEKRTGKKDEPKISAMDFVGLGFADKKEGRALPAGLVPISDPFTEGDLPDVEIIVGDTRNFVKEQRSKSYTTTEDDLELYKPKVSTWGVFPRPNNISSAYGGGKTIRPGDVLETAESKAAKEARTKQMIASYKRQIGLNIDPKLKVECEKDLKDGDSLMEIGKLRDAIPFYEKVMDKLVYQSELHGLAALQWSICLDSLNRSIEARVMYEKLQSHPNVSVSKRARQFLFSFKAMEMMKVTTSSVPQRKTGYQNFFDAFVENKNNYETGVEEDATIQALPYLIFLVSPILIILIIALQKRVV